MRAMTIVLIGLVFVGCASKSNTSHKRSPIPVGNSIPDDIATANYFLSCAASKADELFIRKEMGQNVDSLYAVIGYYKAAGQAFSSRSYADMKYSDLRETHKAHATKVLSVPQAQMAASAQAYLDSLSSTIDECTRIREMKSAELVTRMQKEGVL